MAVISRAAGDPAADVEKLDRLVGLYERSLSRSAQAAFTAAFANMQAELPVIAESEGKRPVIPTQGGH